MSEIKLSVVEIIHPQSNKFATGVESKGTGDLKLNDSPESCLNYIGAFVISCNKITNLELTTPFC